MSNWRIRPIGELLGDGEQLGRLHKGIHFWPFTVQDWLYLIISGSLLYFSIYGSFEAWKYILSVFHN